jgi:hypothetical protein
MKYAIPFLPRFRRELLMVEIPDNTDRHFRDKAAVVDVEFILDEKDYPVKSQRFDAIGGVS